MLAACKTAEFRLEAMCSVCLHVRTVWHRYRMHVSAGVFDAVKRGYLKTLVFGISSNCEGTDLMEVSQERQASLFILAPCSSYTISRCECCKGGRDHCMPTPLTVRSAIKPLTFLPYCNLSPCHCC